MAGYRSKNLLEDIPALTTSVGLKYPARGFKIAESDSQTFVVQVNSAADSVPTLETSYDSGATWVAITATATTAFASGKTTLEYVFMGYDAATSKMLGSLARMSFGAVTTVSSIWITRKT